MFDHDELMFMIDALNGVICTPETFAANLWGWVPYGGANSERIEPNVMIGKVNRLPADQVAKLHSQIVRFWEMGTIPDVRGRMEEVGLLEWEGQA